jgi:uncharacterized protein
MPAPPTGWRDVRPAPRPFDRGRNAGAVRVRVCDASTRRAHRRGLHDDEALDALVDAGADIEAPGAVIGGGPPLADATAFGQWKAARRLIERGARTTLWYAAALGLMDQVRAHVAGEPSPTAEEVTEAFWAACHGAQREAAAYLLGRGADLNWVATWDGLTPLDAARHSEQDGLDPGEVVAWLLAQGARSAGELG